jgi:hypothetical protein
MGLLGAEEADRIDQVGFGELGCEPRTSFKLPEGDVRHPDHGNGTEIRLVGDELSHTGVVESTEMDCDSRLWELGDGMENLPYRVDAGPVLEISRSQLGKDEETL